VSFASYGSPIKEWYDMSPTLSFNGDTDVSTQLTEITFKVDKESIAECVFEQNKYKLKVKDRPEENTQVIVTAYLDNEPIGKQNYIIAKKESASAPPNNNVTGKIMYKRQTDNDSNYQEVTSNTTFTGREIVRYYFKAVYLNGNVPTTVLWKSDFDGITPEKASQNPLNINTTQNAGNHKLEFWSNGKKVAGVNIKITN